MEFFSGIYDYFFPPQTKCSCKHTKSKDYCDSIARLLQMSNLNKNFDEKYAKETYLKLSKYDEKQLNIKEDNLKQINKDLKRTYPSYILYKDELTLEKLKNILRAFSNYEKEIQYYQGMNFIVGFFLYHSEEYVSFWLFATLIEDYDLRSMYIKGFPGLEKHTKNVENILKEKYNELYKILNTLDVNIKIIMIEWLYSLFSSLIPLDLQINFYNGFFAQGWKFFYKMCISMFLNLKGTFNEAADVYIALKFGKNDDEKKNEINENWDKIIKKAYEINI
jgi:hypothetical protein